MKNKHIIILILLGLLAYFTFQAIANSSFSLFLPDTPSSPSLPYAAEQDHYSGPACIQMILNSCPSLSARHLVSQNDIYSSILLHNSEPALWFSNPLGMEGALEDSALSPCGTWSDFSNTDKTYVLGKMLYYMNTQRYLTPVSIGNSEHWIVVCGYQTDVQPTSSSSTVTLLNIFFYDPLPLSPSSGFVSGTMWLSNSAYWGVPLSKSGSAWNNKYIAVIEPPELNITVKFPKWVLKGRILPETRIIQSFNRWVNTIKEEKLARGPLEILLKDVKIERPLLVKAANYSYYLIPFQNPRLAAIFNAYNGSFEEVRCFLKPQKYIADPKMIDGRLRETLSSSKAELKKMSAPELGYNPELALVGRFSPTWKVQAIVQDKKGKERQITVFLNSSGEVVKGLEEIARF